MWVGNRSGSGLRSRRCCLGLVERPRREGLTGDAVPFGADGGSDSPGVGAPLLFGNDESPAGGITFAPLPFGAALAGSPEAGASGAVFCGADTPPPPVDAEAAGEPVSVPPGAEGAAPSVGLPVSVAAGDVGAEPLAGLPVSVPAGLVATPFVEPSLPGPVGDGVPPSDGVPVDAGAVDPGTAAPTSGTVGAVAFPPLPPESIALCTPPAPALVKVSTPISSLKSRSMNAAPTPAAATWADTSAPNSVTVPPITLVAALPANDDVASPRAPVPPPSTPPTAPPTAPPRVANPRSANPNLSRLRSPLET